MRIKNYKSYITLCLFAGIFAVSCKTTQDAVEQPKRLNEKEAVELLFAKTVIPFYCFYSKIGIDYSDSARSQSFKATVKMKVDSAFAGTLSVGPVIGASYMVTQDSIFFTDKMKNCYFKENLNYLTGIFGTAIAYEFFQSLILGLPLGIDQEIKYNYKHTRDYYILSSYKKKDLKKIDADEEEDIFVQYYINTTTLYLDRIAIQVPSDTVTIDIDYGNRVNYDNFMLPELTKLKIVHPRDSILIQMDYGSVKLNDCKEIDINIPDSYVKCK